MKPSYFFSLLSALLIILFYLGLPELKSCPLPSPQGAEPRRGRLRERAAIVLLTLAYAALAFFRLGDTTAPQSFRAFEDESLTLELASPARPARLELYSGLVPGSYSFELSPDGELWLPAAEFQQGYAALLKWQELTLEPTETPMRYLRVTGWDGAELGELALFDESGARLGWAAVTALTDEQALVPMEPDYLNSSYFDEIYHARTAAEHLRALRPYEISHPPLGKLLIALGIRLFGLTPFGWRFMGTLMGVLMLPALWCFARKLFGGRLVPGCCAALLAADFMHFTQTRLATIDSYAVFFTLLMYGFFWLWLSEGKRRDLALAGLFFGLGAASKWTCLYAGAGLGVAWLCRWIGVLSASRKNADFQARITEFFGNVGFCLVFFVLVPLAIYCLSYLPYAAPNGLRPFSGGYFRMVWENQLYMFRYHSGVDATHPYSSRWYQWLLDIRPILYYLHYFPDGTRSSFGAWLNPLLCWAGLLALFVLGYTALFRRDRRAAFLLLGYAAQLLPWVFITRVVFEYHYFACSVFLVLALGYVFALMREAAEPGWQMRVLGFVLLSAAVFAMFYPALSGARVDNEAATKLLKWLPTWPFVRILS